MSLFLALTFVLNIIRKDALQVTSVTRKRREVY